MSDVVRIPPNRLTNSLKDTAIGILKEKYESMISPELGYVVMIIDATANAVGKLVAGDGATYHKVTFEALTFYPKLQEVVEGEVVEITDFGAFVRIGPTDALLHLSQITDDYLKSDVKQGVIVANQSAKSLKIGSRIRARVTAVSLGKGARNGQNWHNMQTTISWRKRMDRAGNKEGKTAANSCSDKERRGQQVGD